MSAEKWDGLPHDHPVAAHLHRMEDDFKALGQHADGMHPANLEAITIAEWLVAAVDDQLPGNVRDYCADVAVMRARTRFYMRRIHTAQEREVAARYVAAEYAAGHMPDDASALVQDE